ncbi:hypothetical protein ACOMHN_037029 [Nucella lapillus]
MTPSGATCNPFDKHGHFKTLKCWAGWEEGDYIFLVAADRSEPKYCLRFPKNQEGVFSVLVYFSVICPIERDGKPPHGIEYYELRMQRKDPSDCRDEDVLHCKAVAERNHCSRDKDFAKHCPQSCALCNSARADIEAGISVLPLPLDLVSMAQSTADTMAAIYVIESAGGRVLLSM